MSEHAPEHAPRRIPSAEATECPYWMIIDPARAMLPHPMDVSDPADTDCAVCGAYAGDPCVQTDDEDEPGAERDEFHDGGRHDYRDEVSAENLAPVMTGPFFSRSAAAAYLHTKKHRFSTRARVWCASGHESGDWRAFCVESVGELDQELARLRRELAVECGDTAQALDGWRLVSESVWAHENGVYIVRCHEDARCVWRAYMPGSGLTEGLMIGTRSTRIDGEWATALQAMEAMAR